jgi:hypothetical protein
MIIVSTEWNEEQEDLEIFYIGSKGQVPLSVYAKTLIDAIKEYYPQNFHKHDYPEYSLFELSIAALEKLIEQY